MFTFRILAPYECAAACLLPLQRRPFSRESISCWAFRQFICIGVRDNVFLNIYVFSSYISFAVFSSFTWVLFSDVCEMTSTVAFLLLVVFVSRYILASDDCKGGALVVPSSGPSVCLPLDDYIELQKGATPDVQSVSSIMSIV